MLAISTIVPGRVERVERGSNCAYLLGQRIVSPFYLRLRQRTAYRESLLYASRHWQDSGKKRYSSDKYLFHI